MNLIYKVVKVRGTNEDEACRLFSELVANNMKLGWVPQGGVAVKEGMDGYTTFAQALLRGPSIILNCDVEDPT